MNERPTLASLSTAPRDEFVRVLGGIFEHTPWIAERAYAARPFASVEDLHRAMVAALASAPASAVLAVGGGAATSSDPTVQVVRFDWNDAGLGIGVGAAAGAMVGGTALIVRRHRIAPHDAARPAAR